MYELYLNLNYVLSIDNVLNTKFNRDVVLIDTKTMIWQHSDCDKNTCHLEWKHS